MPNDNNNKTLRQKLQESKDLSSYGVGNKKKIITENSFDGAGGGTSGTLNYQTPVATNDRNVSLTSYGADHYGTGLTDNGGDGEKVDMETIYQKVKDLYAKAKGADFPSLDEVLAGLSYELGKSIKPDKHHAMLEVLKNLESDPKYYSKLKQIGLPEPGEDDDEVEEPKNKWSVSWKKPSYQPSSGVKANIDEIKKIMRQMKQEKRDRHL